MGEGNQQVQRVEIVNRKSSGLATAGLVLGVIGLVFAFIPLFGMVVAIICGVLALIFGLVATIQKHGGKAIAALVLGILAIVVTILMSVVVYKATKDASDTISKAVNDANNTINDASGSNTDKLLQTDVNVTIGDFSATDSGYGTYDTKLPVTVKNISSKTESYIITIAAESTDGKTQIATDTVVVNSLTAGQTSQQTAFSYVNSDQIDAMKSATFKVSSISKTDN